MSSFDSGKNKQVSFIICVYDFRLKEYVDGYEEVKVTFFIYPQFFHLSFPHSITM